ncbi:MAG: hypothetical protein HY556_05305 [Euryarchaeota archaeon]|nr:hypothetical protein [Euryarchaeota archaeon]
MANLAVIRVSDSDKRDFDLFKAELAKERGSMVTQDEAFREILARARSKPTTGEEKLKPPNFF